MTRIDVDNSRYHERDDLNIGPSKSDDFTRAEILKARYMLRRLRFLETQIRENGGLKSGSSSGGAAHAEWEVDGLEWLLGPDGVDFLAPIDESER